MNFRSRDILLQIDLQQRGVEFSQLFRKFDHMRAALLEPMPPMERDTNSLGDEDIRINGAPNGIEGSSVGGGALLPDVGGGNNDLLDLIVGDSSSVSSAPTATPTATKDNASLLDLLGDLDLSSPAQPPPSTSSLIMGGGPALVPAAAPSSIPLNPLDGLLSGLQSNNNSSNNTSSSLVNNLDDLLGSSNSSNMTAGLPPVQAYNQNGLSVSFHFDDGPPPASSNFVMLTLRAVNSNSTGAVTAFEFQAAVPKSMQLELQKASSTSVAPSGGQVTQRMKVTNPGRSPLRMRVRLSYVSAEGLPVQYQGEVSHFPAALWNNL